MRTQLNSQKRKIMYVFDFCALYEYEMAQDIKSYLNTDFSPLSEESNNIRNIKNVN